MTVTRASEVAHSPKVHVELLECTLRDGSYAVDFQFTAEDTRLIGRSLDALGFSLIEVGHGIGIGASECGPTAAASDLEYAKAAQDSIVEGKWGMFAIWGIATDQQILSMKEEGMSFVRIGVDPGHVGEALPMIATARSAGLDVFVNLMKSYTAEPGALGRLVGVLERAGASGIYLVDSAGGMLPDQFRGYVDAMLESRDSALLGFHGHDNLGLAVAHSLEAATCGFDIIDCTMQGLGRSAGNASTERLVAILARIGDSRFEVSDVCRTGEHLVRPLIPRAGFSGLDTFAGFTLFHSSYLPRILDVARRMRVDPYLLMQEHCSVDQLNAEVQDLEMLAERMAQEGTKYDKALPRDHYVGGDQ